jgi:hypothetical protein
MYRPKFFVRESPPYYGKVAVVSSMDDIPENLSRDIFLVNRAGINRWVVLACPCGCGERLDVNLMSHRRPHWRLRQHRGAISLLPSLWVSKERCGSHFWLIRNRVVWTASDDRLARSETLADRLREIFSGLVPRRYRD